MVDECRGVGDSVQDFLREANRVRSKCIIGGTPADPVFRRNAESEESKKEPKIKHSRDVQMIIFILLKVYTRS